MISSTPSGLSLKPRFKPFFVVFGFLFVPMVLVAVIGHALPLSSRTIDIKVCETSQPGLKTQRYQIFGQSTVVYGNSGSYPYDYAGFKSVNEGNPENNWAFDCGAQLGGKKFATKLKATLYLW